MGRSVLREWDLLCAHVLPALEKVALRRAPRAWSVNSSEDALAIAVGYAHRARGRRQLDSFVTGAGRAGSGFRLQDVRCVPGLATSPSVCRRPTGWVPDARIAERILVAPPDGPVDLLTWRRPEAGRRGNGARPDLSRLRSGGIFLTTGPEGGFDGVGMEPLDDSGRLYRKVGGLTAHKTGPAAVSTDVAGVMESLADRRAREELVERHFPLARSLARRFQHRGETAEDLEQVAYLALIRAAGRFDAGRGSAFATFATVSILGELKRHFRDRAWMLKVPRSLQEAYLVVKAARDELSQELATSPTVAQIAEHLGISEDLVLDAMEAGENYWPESTDRVTGEDSWADSHLGSEDTNFQRALELRELRDALPRLGDRERLVLERLYFAGRSQREVAAELGVSQMQVSRILAGVLAGLRHSLAEDRSA